MFNPKQENGVLQRYSMLMRHNSQSENKLKRWLALTYKAARPAAHRLVSLLF
jgi:hypothetical protein